MDLRELEHARGARHPWERVRASFFVELLADHTALGAARRVLDVGSGDGYFAIQLARRLAADTQVVCWDIHYTDEQLDTLGRNTPDSILHTAAAPAGQFDVMLFLDVLEHVPDDLGLLRTLTAEHLAPGGVALVSVPAYQALFSEHDRALGHERRYLPRDFYRVVEAAGLRICERGGLFSSLLVPRGYLTLRERLRQPGGVVEELLGPRWRHGAWFTRAVMAGLELDGTLARLASRAHLPLPGLTTWAICQRA